MVILPLLSQVDTAPDPWWMVVLNNALGLTLLFIFLTAIIGTIVARRRKDKCFKLFNGYTVSYLGVKGKTLWGNLRVYSQGLELTFEKPYTGRDGLTKASALLYDVDLADCLVACRLSDGLNERQRRRRRKQVHRCFRPGVVRRTCRWCRNLINTLKDAFSKALSTILGQIARSRPAGGVVSTHHTSVDQIGQKILGAVGNAYEPMLEAYIGKPVVIQLAVPHDAEQPPVELPGFLAEYTEKYLAVFNLKHEPIERLELTVGESVQRPGVRIELQERNVVVTSTCADVIVVQRCASGRHVLEPRLPLTNNCSVTLPRQPGQPITLNLERTQRIDMVCPRSQAKIYFGGAADGKPPLIWEEERQSSQLDTPTLVQAGASPIVSD